MDLALQLFVVGLSQAAIYSLVALGFALIYSVTHVFHFAHGAFLALAGFVTYAFAEQMGIPLAVAFVLTACITIGLAVAVFAFVYDPLKRTSINPLVIVLVSIGIQIAMENIMALVWGTGGRYLPNPFSDYIYVYGGVVIALTDVITVLLALGLTLATVLFLRLTRMGRAMRALRDNPLMAQVVGINPRIAGMTAIAIGTFLVVPAAIITGWYSSLVPSMGMQPLLYSVAAVVVGGMGSVFGAALGGLMLGLVSAAISFYLPAFWSDAGAFLIMMVFVVWFPSGLFGVRAKSHSAR